MKSTTQRVAAFSALFLPAAAFAHPDTHTGFMQGLVHPVSGVDHVLAMIAVGVLASRLQGVKRMAPPAAFILAMMGGGALGATGIALPWIELLIAASLVAFGLSIARARAGTVWAISLMVGCFGVFHGHAHGTEMVGDSVVLYGVGFTLSTAALHALGLTCTVLLQAHDERAKTFVRALGGVIAATGITLLAFAA
jgi:urease accessory protein